MKKPLCLLFFCLSFFVMTSSTPTPIVDPPTSFFDAFDGPALNPAWQVVQYTAPRVYGFTSPANHYSIEDAPGYLRYYSDPMTQGHGFMNYFQPFYIYYWYDPGLEIRRPFSGDHWVLETKADYFLPKEHGRYFIFRTYFGEGGIDVYWLSFERFRAERPYYEDGLYENGYLVQLHHQVGVMEPYYGTGDTVIAVDYQPQIFPPGSDRNTLFFKLVRDGGLLMAYVSFDGNLWNLAFSREMGTVLDGLDQQVVITGHSWFYPAGSYADYDYVRLTRNVILCSLNIDPNKLNPKSGGNWITAYISLPEGYDPAEIDLATLKLQYNTGQVLADWGQVEGNLFMAKFKRADVINMLSGVKESVGLKISGQVSGVLFEGTDTIFVLK